MPITAQWARTKRWVRNRLWPGGMVLCYHRVAEPAFDPCHMCVSPQHLAEHLQVLRSRGSIVPLATLVRRLAEGERPARCVALTFDDGYADNLWTAKPLLERHEAPATFFVTTGVFDTGGEFFWDELEQLVFQATDLPACLQLTVKGKLWVWSRPAAGNPHEVKGELYAIIRKLLRRLTAAERRTVMDDLASQLGDAEPARVRPTHRPLTPEEACMLGASSLTEIGTHTASHVALEHHGPAVQREELAGSKKRLEEILARPVRSCAYPHGSYNAETVRIVDELGFTCGCTTVPQPVWRHTSRFALPRLMIRDCDGDTFEKTLRSIALG